MKQVFLVLGFGVSLCSVALGSDLRGRVAMQGSILETPCAIATASTDQTVDLGVVPLSTIQQWTQSVPTPVVVNLIDCRLHSRDGEVWRTFTVTFDGPSDPYGFSVWGSASGVSLALEDAGGGRILAGVPLPAQVLTLGGQQLQYGLRVISNHTPYTPGDFQTTLRFKLDYF